MKGFWVLQLPVANRQEKESATDRKFTPNRRGNEPQSKKHCTSFCTKDRSGRWQSKRTDLLSENSCQCHPIAIPRTISTNCRTFRCYGSNFNKMLLNKQRVHFRFSVFGSNHGGPSGTTKGAMSSKFISESSKCDSTRCSKGWIVLSCSSQTLSYKGQKNSHEKVPKDKHSIWLHTAYQAWHIYPPVKALLLQHTNC